MLHLKLKEDQREEGFTLIELLIVVVIIGILAAIAIPVFMNQREDAWRSSVQSDIRNVATQVEVEYSQEGDYDTAWTSVAGGSGSYTIGDNTLTFTTGDSGFCIEGENDNLTDEPYSLDLRGGADDASAMSEVAQAPCDA